MTVRIFRRRLLMAVAVIAGGGLSLMSATAQTIAAGSGYDGGHEAPYAAARPTTSTDPAANDAPTSGAGNSAGDPGSVGSSDAGADAGSGSAASDFYCGQRRLGTWFYCEKPKRAAPRTPNAPPPGATATMQLASITRELDELKARAILDPSEENVTNYVRFQRQQLDRSSMFADVWQRAMWQHPDLDYTLQRPVSTLGKRAWIDNRQAEQDQVLHHLSDRYGMFYFYAQSCAACEVFGPILKSLSLKSGFDVVAVSMDGGPNRSFPDYVVDSGQYARMGLTSRATPALVLFDTLTKRAIPIGTGILSADEITERIFTLTHTRPGSDY